MITKKIVLDSVSVVMGVPKELILVDRHESQAKEADTAFARQVCMALCRKYELGTLESIGKYFSRDHSTVLHAVKVINNEIEIYPQKRMIYENIQIEIIRQAKANLKVSLKQMIENQVILFETRVKKISEQMISDIDNKL